MIVQGPLSQGVLPDTLVTLSAEVTGHPLPFTFEWRRITPLVTNVVYGPSNFFTFTAASTITTQLFRVVIKNLANSSPGVISSPASIVTLLDSDVDEIPDDWELFFGFNPDSGEDRDFDADLDGMTNLQEYRSGTDPTNSASVFRLDISPALPRALSFGAASNHTYTVEFADDVAGPWTRLADFVARATNRVEAVVDPAATTNRYYRAITPRQPEP